MQPGGSLEPALGNLVGSGTGAGIALIFLVTGILGAGVSLAGYLFPAVREAEDRLPDHDVMLAHA
jgi:hypothetical protein